MFLEKKPVFNCREVLTRAHDEEYVTDWQICKDHDYCTKPENLRRVNWTDPESIHNLVEQLDFYCEPDMMIGLIGALFLLGIVVGCSTLTRLGDVYGRKPIYLLGLFMHIFFMIGIIWSTNKFISYFLLFIFGMSVTARYYVGYTYNLEMQPKSQYVLVSTTMFMFESMVYFFICIYFRYIAKNWVVLQVPNLIFAISGIIFLLMMPESPKFLIAQKKFDEARLVFQWIGLKNGLPLIEITEKLDSIKFEGEDEIDNILRNKKKDRSNTDQDSDFESRKKLLAKS